MWIKLLGCMAAALVWLFAGVQNMCAGEFVENQPEKRIVILLGPPGSGKGTQAVKLAEALKIPHISTGDLFRDNLKRQTELGAKVKAYMEEGKLVPDSLVLDMLFQRVAAEDARNGYLLDGFPRTIPQAEALEEKLKAFPHKLIVLNLEIADSAIVSRMSGRLSCPSCGRVYHKVTAPPQKEGCCDVCSGELIQRSDDREEVVLERLKIYHEQTKPLIGFYSKRGELHSVDATESPEAVYKSLLQAVK
jgi:adenylate kinase